MSSARQVGYAQSTGEFEVAANIQCLAVSYLDRVAGAGQTALRTLADALDARMSLQLMTAVDIIGQRFRAVEASVLEEGGWGAARHLEVTRVS